jgi:hypothetical protein
MGTSDMGCSIFEEINVKIFNILIFNVWPTTNNYESSLFTNN